MDPTYLRQEAHARNLLERFLEYLKDRSYLVPPNDADLEHLIEAFIAKQPRSVVMLLTNANGEILSVSRRGRPDDLGLPGGKIDPGELPLEAAIRETFEETGVKVSTAQFIFERVDKTDGRVAWCFRAINWEGEPKSCEPGIEVQWVKPERLLKPSCTFHEYNRGLFASAMKSSR